MFKVSVVLVLALLCSGCASSASNSVVSAKSPVMKKSDKLVKYASNQGCTMLSNGYMVCAKTR